MDVVSLKYWHWAVLGLLVGGLMGYVWTGFDPTMPRSGEVAQFKRWVGTTATAGVNAGKPRIYDIVVMEPETDPMGKVVYPTTYKLLGTDKTRTASKYELQSLYAEQKFDGSESILAFLKGKHVPFSDRTGPGKYLPVAYGMTAGLVGIGLIWPTVVRLLVGAGFAAPKPVEDKKVYATGEQDDGTVKTKRPRFRFFGGGSDGEATPDPLAPPVVAVDGAPLDGLFQSTAPSLAAADRGTRAPVQPKKEYEGAYYPVARPAVKDGEAAN